jgi:hypothetical protein
MLKPSGFERCYAAASSDGTTHKAYFNQTSGLEARYQWNHFYEGCLDMQMTSADKPFIKVLQNLFPRSGCCFFIQNREDAGFSHVHLWFEKGLDHLAQNTTTHTRASSVIHTHYLCCFFGSTYKSI